MGKLQVSAAQGIDFPPKAQTTFPPDDQQASSDGKRSTDQGDFRWQFSKHEITDQQRKNDLGIVKRRDNCSLCISVCSGHEYLRDPAEKACQNQQACRFP